jgi:GT2 family glycosyltransferase
VSLPLVGVVVLTWQCGDLVLRAVESATGSRGVEVDLVVVDNGSKDAATQRALDEAERRGARVHRLVSNTGFARGMNTGYDLVRGDPVVLLNCDAVLHPDALAAAVRTLAEQPDVGVLAPHVTKLAPTGEWRFWDFPEVATGFDGGVIGLDRHGRVTSLGDTGGPAQESFKPNGACPVVRRAVVEQLRATYGSGPFDPLFDTYGEDVDAAWKTWALGWRVLYDPQVRAGHVRSYASALEMEDKRGRLRTNLVVERYVNAARHRAPRPAAQQLAGALAGDLGMLAGQLRRGDLRVVPDVVRGWARVARAVPGLVAYRRRHREWGRRVGGLDVVPAEHAA